MLQKLRDRIDWLDEHIAFLMDARMKTVDQVGRLKSTLHQDVTDLSREDNVLQHVQDAVQHPILKTNIVNIYKEIMLEARVAQQFFRHTSQPFRRIGIIGLGMMGASISKALKTKDPLIELCTIMHPGNDTSQAYAGGWIDRMFSTLAELIENIDLIILASPISTIIAYANEIAQHASQNKKLIVLDIASVKLDIVKAFEALTSEQIEYVGSHPMAGNETSGFAGSQPTLFVNRPWVIVPHSKNTAETLGSIEELIQFFGAKLTSLDAEIHDQRVSLISHLPAFISKSYLDFVNSTDPQSSLIAGPGFESFTRLASQNEQMQVEIEKYNKNFIQAYLKQWLAVLENREEHS